LWLRQLAHSPCGEAVKGKVTLFMLLELI